MWKASFLALAAGVAHGAENYTEAIEVMWVQDLSQSYQDDLPNIRSQLSDTFEELKWVFPSSRFGLASFVDKPMTESGVRSMDYCYALHEKLTRYTHKLRDTLRGFRVRSGGDWPESQLEALLAAAQSDEVGWTETEKNDEGYRVRKFVVVATDAGFHQAGDTELPANDYNGEVDCLLEDYPSVEEVKKVLSEKRIMPIFLATEDAMPTYRKLVHDLGDNGAAWMVHDDSSDLRSVLTTVLDMILRDESGERGAAKCAEDGCYVGCVGSSCCNGKECDVLAERAVVIRFDNVPKKLRVVAENDEAAGAA